MTTPVCCLTPAKYPSTYRNMLRRAGCLKITEDELAGKSLREIKALAKKRYRALAQHYHPDRVEREHSRHFAKNKYTAAGYGATFRAITKTYEWFMKLDAITERKKFKLGNNVPDDPLPWYLERKPVQLPNGFHETREYLAYA
jgi:hypothetical protein